MTMSVWNFISRNEQMHYCDEAFPPFVITSSAQWLKRVQKFYKLLGNKSFSMELMELIKKCKPL